MENGKIRPIADPRPIEEKFETVDGVGEAIFYAEFSTNLSIVGLSAIITRRQR